MKRRAQSAAAWQAVRKDSTTSKDMIGSDAGGAALPAQSVLRDPGNRRKHPHGPDDPVVKDFESAPVDAPDGKPPHLGDGPDRGADEEGKPTAEPGMAGEIDVEARDDMGVIIHKFTDTKDGQPTYCGAGGCSCESCSAKPQAAPNPLNTVTDAPVSKPLPRPSGGESQSGFVSSCMGDPKMLQEFPDQKQRAAVCYSQAKKSTDALGSDDNAMTQGYKLDDRVCVTPGKEHIPTHAGVYAKIALIEGSSMGLKFDGSDDVYKWYAPSEIEPQPTMNKALQEDQQAAGDTSPGVMLALWTPEEIAHAIKQPGGVEPKDMHVTLGYYGKVGKDLHPDHVKTIEKCVAMSAEGYKPVHGHIGGIGRFNATESSDNKDVLIAHVDSPGLHDVRDHLIQHVRKCAGVVKSLDTPPEEPERPMVDTSQTDADTYPEPVPLRTHGYTPHITLAYINPQDPMPVHKLDRRPVTFTHLAMAVGKKVTMFKLGERQVTKRMNYQILKADDSQRLATGIVLQPEEVDAQGDIISAEVIKETAHNFLAMYNRKTMMGLQHEVMKPQGVELVESWITPITFELNNRVIREGTWMMTVRILNDDIWNMVKVGKLTGFSIGGTARVQKL